MSCSRVALRLQCAKEQTVQKYAEQVEQYEVVASPRTSQDWQARRFIPRIASQEDFLVLSSRTNTDWTGKIWLA